MNLNQSTWRLFAPLLAALLPALVTLILLHFIAVPGLGPGSAAGWANLALGEAEPAGAAQAPLLRLLVRLAGALGDPASAAARLNLLAALGSALAAAMAGLLLHSLLLRWRSPAPLTLASAGGTLTGLSSSLLAAGQLIGPGSWALGLLLASAASLGRRSPSIRSLALGLFLAALAVSAQIGAALLLLPLLPAMARRLAALETPKRLLLLLLAALPLTLFALPRMAALLPVAGLLSAPRLLPTGGGLLASAVHAAQALSPFALPIALWGLWSLLRRDSSLRRPVLLTLVALAVASLVPFSSELAALASGLAAALLSSVGFVELLARLPRGLQGVGWLLVIGTALGQGLRLDRSGESIWQTHAYNSFVTTRYKSVVLSTDTATLNAPFRYIRASQDKRPDIALVNPMRLDEPDYVREVAPGIRVRADSSTRTLLDSLLDAKPGQQALDKRRSIALAMLGSWIEHETATQAEHGGVMVSPGYRPPTAHELVAEGLLLRISPPGMQYPFLFRTLDLSPIRFREQASALEHGVVSLYPLLFTERGRWLLEQQYTVEGFDYIRWALKIDRDYLPARLIAREYGIHGEPKRLQPRQF